MQDTYDITRELDLLDPREITLSLDEFEELYLERPNCKPLGPLTAHRAFPVTAPHEFIVLRDEEENEIGAVRRLEDLDPESRAVLEFELQWTYFKATIVRVNAITLRHHIPNWDVVTDRGPRVFELRSHRREVHVLPHGRVLVRDADGNRYEIPDYRELDPASRALVEAQI